MSQYINFYLRDQNKDTYVSIMDYSRNSSMYEIFHDEFPYERGRQLTYAKVEEARCRIKNEIDECYKNIKDARKIIKLAFTSLRPLDEINQYVYEQRVLINDLKERIKSYRSAQRDIEFMWDMTYCGREDEDREIWVGVEWDPNYKES